MKSVAVFCSANSNLAPDIEAEARRFGRELAFHEIELVYGGGHVGLMGIVADGCLTAGGVVRGAIPHDLAKTAEIAHKDITELVYVDDLFERKRWMMERAAAFAILPGGFGTLDEALEVITWKALGHHDKPVVFLNIQGFWSGQLRVFQDMMDKGFIRDQHKNLYQVADTIHAALELFRRGFG